MLHLLGGIAQVKVDIAIKEAEYVMVQMDDIIMGTDREDVIMEISAIQLMGNESIVGRINHHIHLAVLVHLVPQGVAEIVLLEDIKIKTVKDRVKIVVSNFTFFHSPAQQDKHRHTRTRNKKYNNPF